mmetsp:Transcript_58116/g.166695  ORF Transcript_58116/g.166695 Transcript_58116/m.166695 type:complete len:465 (-) Transcript_58116:1220-2614(-)
MALQFNTKSPELDPQVVHGNDQIQASNAQDDSTARKMHITVCDDVALRRPTTHEPPGFRIFQLPIKTLRQHLIQLDREIGQSMPDHGILNDLVEPRDVGEHPTHIIWQSRELARDVELWHRWVPASVIRKCRHPCRPIALPLDTLSSRRHRLVRRLRTPRLPIGARVARRASRDGGRTCQRQTRQRQRRIRRRRDGMDGQRLRDLNREDHCRRQGQRLRVCHRCRSRKRCRRRWWFRHRRRLRRRRRQRHRPSWHERRGRRSQGLIGEARRQRRPVQHCRRGHGGHRHHAAWRQKGRQRRRCQRCRGWRCRQSSPGHAVERCSGNHRRWNSQVWGGRGSCASRELQPSSLLHLGSLQLLAFAAPTFIFFTTWCRVAVVAVGPLVLESVASVLHTDGGLLHDGIKVRLRPVIFIPIVARPPLVLELQDRNFDGPMGLYRNHGIAVCNFRGPCGGNQRTLFQRPNL